MLIVILFSFSLFIFFIKKEGSHFIYADFYGGFFFFYTSWMGGVENYSYQHKVYQAYCRLKTTTTVE